MNRPSSAFCGSLPVTTSFFEAIGNIPPAELEKPYYKQLESQPMAA
ncbi:MAG: hypothetical protein IH838_09390 [Proteobacteria bacterium]|nr:hypothetical protein [Pseudomonadota bacterium]